MNQTASTKFSVCTP